MITALIVSGSAFSQTVNRAPSFEAASVRIAGPRQPGPGGPSGGPGTNDPTRFTYAYVNLQTLLTLAYGVRTDQISAPDWIKDSSDGRTLYTVTAVVPPNTSKDRFNVMLQNLLAERFHLALHHSTKEFPGYELRVAEGGPKLKPYVPADSAANSSDSGRAKEDGFPRLGPGPNSTVAFSMPTGGGWAMLRARYRMPMSQFVVGLGGAVNESMGLEMGATMPRVADKTGLTGVYEFTLGFAGMLIMPGLTPPPSGAADSATHAASDPGEIGPSLFNALETQLGLKLVKTKNVSVDILVIDHAEKVPAEN